MVANVLHPDTGFDVHAAGQGNGVFVLGVLGTIAWLTGFNLRAGVPERH